MTYPDSHIFSTTHGRYQLDDILWNPSRFFECHGWLTLPLVCCHTLWKHTMPIFYQSQNAPLSILKKLWNGLKSCMGVIKLFSSRLWCWQPQPISHFLKEKKTFLHWAWYALYWKELQTSIQYCHFVVKFLDNLLKLNTYPFLFASPFKILILADIVISGILHISMIPSF